MRRTPARALCLSQQGNAHGSICKTLRTHLRLQHIPVHGTRISQCHTSLDIVWLIGGCNAGSLLSYYYGLQASNEQNTKKRSFEPVHEGVHNS